MVWGAFVVLKLAKVTAFLLALGFLLPTSVINKQECQ